MIKMIKDFRGRASGERYFKENEIVELPEEFESAMVMEGVAKKITEEIKHGVEPVIVPVEIKGTKKVKK